MLAAASLLCAAAFSRAALLGGEPRDTLGTRYAPSAELLEARMGDGLLGEVCSSVCAASLPALLACTRQCELSMMLP